MEKLDPQSRIGMETGNSRQITYTLDLTRHYNLLERAEESRNQRYFWDGNVAAYEENGERNYYLRTNWVARFRLKTMPESSGKAMDTELLGKTCIRTKGGYSHLDIRDTKGIRQRGRIMPRQGNIWQRVAGLQVAV